MNKKTNKKQTNTTQTQTQTYKYTDAKEIEILDQAGIISNYNKQLSDNDNVVLKFRLLVKNQQDEIANLR
jgi:hypothetical protein